MRALRHFILVTCTICLIVGAPPGLSEETIVIVTHRTSGLKRLSFETLKLVYLRKILLDSTGQRWIPVNFPSQHPLRKAFSLELFHNLPQDQENYWNEQYFHGIDPPQVLASEEAVLRFVAITPGAIGYVHKRMVDDRVKILTNISISEHQ